MFFNFSTLFFILENFSVDFMQKHSIVSTWRVSFVLVGCSMQIRKNYCFGFGLFIIFSLLFHGNFRFPYRLFLLGFEQSNETSLLFALLEKLLFFRHFFIF